MNTLSRTDFELQPRTLRSLNAESANLSHSQRQIDADGVIEASRIADSSVPEGGYGWVVSLSCGIMTWWFVGTTYSWGVIQEALVKQNLSSPSTLSFVGSLTVALNAVFAMISSKILRALGARNTALLGVSCLGFGGVLSGFTTGNIGGLFVTTGVIMGIGVSISYIVVSATPAQYFSRKRGLANGIVFASGGLGGAVISFAMDGLLQKLGPAWTFRVIGFLTLVTGWPAAWLIRERSPTRSRAFIDWHLFRDTKFIILFLAGAVATFPLLVPPFFLPLYSASLGLSARTGAGLVAGFNFSSAVGRIGCGFLSDTFGALNTLFASLVLSALSMLILWPVSDSLAPLITFALVNGAANGGFFSTMPTVVSNVFGSVRVSIAMGMIVTGWTGGYLMGAPIAGYLLNAYGGQSAGFEAYRPAIYYAGSLALGSSGLVALARLRMNKRIFTRV